MKIYFKPSTGDSNLLHGLMTCVKFFKTREPSLPDSEERKEYLTLLVGTLIEHYVYTRDTGAKSEMARRHDSPR